MPVNVKDLLRSVEGPNHSDSASEALAAKNPLREILEEQQAHWNKLAVEAFSSKIRADAERMRAETDARRVTNEVRELAISHQEELQRLRKESDTAARKYFWLGVVAGAAFTLVGWLLSALNAGQVLSHLAHP